ncbi:MAG: hypothetical protein FK733_01875 [Asgard group archaeon]|nr:hypothetical protein [Asgard group archaeon]
MKKTKIKGASISLILTLAILSLNLIADFNSNFRITNINSTSKSIAVYSEFDDFNIVLDAPELNNLKTMEQINFTYSGGSGTTYASDLYCLTLDEDCSDFYLEIDVDYSYAGSYLGEFFVSLNSTYSEYGSTADEYGEYQILEAAVVDIESGLGAKCQLTGFPNDTPDQYSTTDGTIGSSGIVMIRIDRDGNHLLCEMENQPDFYFSHVWDIGVSKPLNSICIGGNIFPSISSSLFFTFTYFYSEVTYDGTSQPPTTPTTPTTSTNNTIDLPNWIWYVIAGAGTVSISVLVVVFVFLNKKYK